jgi:hypothetical protein
MLGLAGTADAAAPPSFWRVPQDGLSAAAAGSIDNPRGVAADPATGHVFVADGDNARISEFTAWGEFVKAWGWGVASGATGQEVCGPGASPPTATCQSGIEGSGPGQFARPNGVAVDSTGSVFVVDRANQRVQKFDQAGDFVLTFGGEVNKTKVAAGTSSEAEENLCTAASGDECGAGVIGTGNGAFSEWAVGNFVVVGPDDTIYVGDRDRIQEFDPDGTYKGEIALPEAGLVKALAADPGTGDLYLAFDQDLSKEVPEKPFIYKHTSAGWAPFVEVGHPAGEGFAFPIHGFPLSLAAGSGGELYAVAQQNQTNTTGWMEIVGFDAGGDCLEGLCPGDEFARPTDGTGFNGLATSTACNLPEDDLYATHFSGAKSYLAAFGPPPDPLVCPAPLRAPEIAAQYATSVGANAATVQAQINPQFWADTTYYVQYGTAACPASGWEGPDCHQAPASPALLGAGAVNFAAATAPVALAGLLPQTTYHYRFVAASGGGGPVFGMGGSEGADGQEATFTTLPPADPPNTGCPNQPFRSGASAALPDCRAYEMVSPVDKEGGDALLLNKEALLNQYNQSALDGQWFTYSSYRAFADPQAAPNASQYLATRQDGSGWSSKSISPPRGTRLIGILETAASEFVAFSPDLCEGWLRHDTDHPPFAPGAIAGFSNLYRRDDCGPTGYGAVTRLAPPVSEPNTAPNRFLPELQGLSADGSCAVFRANARLTPDASEKQVTGDGIYQTYETCGEGLRLVSVLPDGSTSEEPSSAGTGTIKVNHRSQSVRGAVSDNGSRVYWTAAGSGAGGRIYVRENAEQEQSAILAGKCSEAEKACTYPVSGTVSGGNARFWAANPDGSLAIFTLEGQLYRFNFATKKATAIAGKVAGVVGTSRDLSRIYLVSEEDKDGAGKAAAGKPNLYRYQGGPLSFIATLSSRDAADENDAISPVNREPLNHTAQVTADGAHLAFMSTAGLTGFDNIDAASGEADAEVYLYSAESDELRCVSCNRVGARPLGRDIGSKASPFWAAARLASWETQLYPSHPLSEDGRRLFFESFESLDPGDNTDGRQDVYEWEAAGSGDCDAGKAAFSAQAGGCVRLISSGKSEEDSVFLDATPTGSDVFFGTASSLLPQDLGQLDVYDARINGGIPSPPGPRIECEGQACRNPGPPPLPLAAGSAVVRRGNPPLHCRKGKRRVRRHGKAVCVKRRNHRAPKRRVAR